MVTITKEDWITKDEVYCDWYQCPMCEKGRLAYGDNYCPNCGEKIEWDVDKK